jgi:transaldolase
MPGRTVAPLQRLAVLGQSVWIDYLSRELLESGELARLVREDAVVGVTSNPTIFQQALAHGDAYDEQLRELLPSGLSSKDLFLELACADVAAGGSAASSSATRRKPTSTRAPARS